MDDAAPAAGRQRLCPRTGNVGRRLRVAVTGNSVGRPVVFAHGYGADQRVWRSVLPAFSGAYRTITFDFTRDSLISAADHATGRHTAAYEYAADVVELCQGLGLRDVVLVGHSLGGIVAALAANIEPRYFAGLVLIGASPRFVNDGTYVGGYTRAEIDELMEVVDSNIAQWSASDAGEPIGGRDPDEAARDAFTGDAGARLGRQFARTAFLCDHRVDLTTVDVPTLILHGAVDYVVPRAVGEYLARSIPGSRFELLPRAGHFPHLEAPDAVVAAVHRFLGTPGTVGRIVNTWSRPVS